MGKDYKLNLLILQVITGSTNTDFTDTHLRGLYIKVVTKAGGIVLTSVWLDTRPLHDLEQEVSGLLLVD